MNHHHVASTEKTRKISNLFNIWSQDKDLVLQSLIDDNFNIWNVIPDDEACSKCSKYLNKGYRKAYSCPGCLNLSRLCDDFDKPFIIELNPLTSNRKTFIPSLRNSSSEVGKKVHRYPAVGKKLIIERFPKGKLTTEYYPEGVPLSQLEQYYIQQLSLIKKKTLCLDVVTLNIVSSWVLEENIAVRQIYHAYACNETINTITEDIKLLKDLPYCKLREKQNVEDIYMKAVDEILGLIYQGLMFFKDVSGKEFLLTDVPGLGFIDEPYVSMEGKSYTLTLKFDNLKHCQVTYGARIIPCFNTSGENLPPDSVNEDIFEEKGPTNYLFPEESINEEILSEETKTLTYDKIFELRKLGFYLYEELNIGYFLLAFLKENLNCKTLIESEPILINLYRLAFPNGIYTMENFNLDKNLGSQMLQYINKF